jgi:hypothetical protein
MKNFATFLLVAFLSFGVNSAFAIDRSTTERPEDVVTSLYRDFGHEIREAITSKPLLVDQTPTVLKKYFTSKLAELIIKDRKQEKATKEIGHIDFVILYGSQDPDGIRNIRITKKPGKNVASVIYDQNDERDVMTINYDLVQTDIGWRISDVHYKARKSTAFPEPAPEFSLLNLLSQPY